MFGHMQADHGMTGFVIGGQFLLVLGHNHRAALCPHHHLVLGILEIVHHDKATVRARGHQRGFVHKVGKVGPGKARRAARDDAQIDIRPQRHLAGMHAQDALATL